MNVYKRIECVLLTFNGTLVCYGGQLENGLATNTMYSLNLYQSWNTTEPAWSIMETAKYDRNDVTRPVAFFAATYLPNAHHFLIDGGTISSENKSSSNNETLYYDPINETWLQPNIRGQRAVRRYKYKKIYDNCIIPLCNNINPLLIGSSIPVYQMIRTGYGYGEV